MSHTLKMVIQQIVGHFSKLPLESNAFPPNFAIKYRKNGTVNCFLTSPFDGYTYCEPFLKISSLHRILAYHAGTTLR